MLAGHDWATTTKMSIKTINNNNKNTCYDEKLIKSLSACLFYNLFLYYNQYTNVYFLVVLFIEKIPNVNRVGLTQ